MDCNLSPLRLIPRQQAVIWGGSLLHRRLGKPRADEAIGESWEVWEGDPVDGGPYSGHTLGQLVDTCRPQVLGSIPSTDQPRRFPLLTKFIDAEEPLSVQVHPNDLQAQRLENQPNGKTEAWYIIEANPGAWIIHGPTEKLDAHELRKRLELGTADDLLRKVNAVPGETVFVPAGTIHAIGPGVLLHEVQQSSDITYRLYDWNRQAHGSRRELHLHKGLEVSAVEPSPSPVIRPISWMEGVSQIDLILACDYFTVKKLSLRGRLGLATEGRSFHIATVVQGACSLTSDFGVETLSLGQSLLIPACIGRYVLEADSEATVLIEYIALVEEDVSPELRSRGFDPVQIGDFLNQFRPVA